MVGIMTAIGHLQQALNGLQPGSPLHKDVNRAIGALSRHLSQNAQPTLGVQRTQAMDQLRNIGRNAMLAMLMAQQQGGQRPDQGAPAGASPGAMAQAPMPSTPLPGA
jgi:hypothetical protein